MKIGLAILAALMVLDGWITNLLISRGLAWELNPLLAGVAGSPKLIVVKVVGAVLAVVLLWRTYRRFPKVASVVTRVGVVFYGVVVVWLASIFVAEV